MSAPVSPQVHVCYELATVPLEPRRPNTDCIATPRLASSLSLSLTHTHSLSLSLSLALSLSLRQWDNNHAHRPSSSTARVLTLGRRSEIDLITLLNSRVDSNSAIQLAAPVRQWAFSSSLSHSPISLLQSFPCLGNPIHILSNRTSQGVLIRSVQPPPEEYRPPTQSHHHGTQQHT